MRLNQRTIWSKWKLLITALYQLQFFLSIAMIFSVVVSQQCLFGWWSAEVFCAQA